MVKRLLVTFAVVVFGAVFVATLTMFMLFESNLSEHHPTQFGGPIAIGLSNGFCLRLCPPEEEPYESFDLRAFVADIAVTAVVLALSRDWPGGAGWRSLYS